MAVQTSYPGVYIDEFAPGAPIQGVGTGVAAFLGPAVQGEIARVAAPDDFERITSFDRFQALFGDAPVEGYFLWYAVRGFFQNGGQACYVARVSNGSYDTWDVVDREPAPANVIFRVRLRTPGPTATTLRVLTLNRLPAATAVFRTPGALPTVAAVAGREITLSAGGGVTFRPGDVITIAARVERPRIVRVAGDVIRIDQDLTPVPAAGDTVRLANLAVGDRTLRITAAVVLAPDLLLPNSVLTITQGALTTTVVVTSVQGEPLPVAAGTMSYRLTLRQGLTVPIDLAPGAAATTVVMEEFQLATALGGTTRTFTPLAPDPAHQNYFRNVINDDATAPIRVAIVEPPPAVTLPLSLPLGGAAVGATTAGVAETLAGLTPQNYRDALAPLERIDAINLVAAPDATRFANAVDTTTVQTDLIASCERLSDRFAVLDPRAGSPMSGANSIETQRRGVDSTRGYAALYYPWIRIPSAGGDVLILAPPSGHICGIMARTDASRGVHKAPANATVDGAVGVERTMTDIEQGFLNLGGINVIRVFAEGGRPVLWGARTTATDRNWQYVNIRRLFLFLEESIAEGIGWSVFEPNNLALWQKLRRTIRDFLRQQWRDGALFGAKEENAFYVRIDDVLNPFSEQQLGRLHIEIGVRPSYPAEFIVVRIGIWDGGSEVSES